MMSCFHEELAMARSFDPVAVLKTLSNSLLRRFLDTHEGHSHSDVPWTLSASPRRITFLEEWMSLAEEKREVMQATLQEIFHLSSDDGMKSLSTELRAARPDSLVEFNRMSNRLDQAMWAWLYHRDIFDHASLFATADRLSHGRSWKRWRISQPTEFVITAEKKHAFEQHLASWYFTREMRGRHCRIHHVRRQGGIHYFFAYLDDWPNSKMKFAADGQLQASHGRYAFQNVFAYDSQKGTLDIFATPRKATDEALPRMFADALLGISQVSAARIRRVYRLDHLLSPQFEFQTDPADSIAHVQLTHMRVGHRNARPNGQYKELGFGRDQSLAQIRECVRKELVELDADSDLLAVHTVGFRLQFRSRSNARAKSLSFYVTAPNTCDLKEKPEDLRMVGEHCLKLWSITHD